MLAARFVHAWERQMPADTARRLQQIWSTIRDIPEGRVASYGQIAEIAGIPRGARQVGRALGQVPDGYHVPWHRVLRSSGELAFDRNSATFKRQARLLAAEHVPVRNGKVNMKKYRWTPDLDELLWKPTDAWDDGEERLP
jgi:methylated-DNA-protein-cysteine methyltransferase related protein